jgi:transposase
MRTKGSPFELERRRILAVTRVREGYSAEEVADFLGVDPSSVRRWIAAFEHDGIGGLVARPAVGRPPKLTHLQEKVVRRWLRENPLDHGFATELWSAPRLAQLIQEEWHVTFHPDYLGTWLRARGYSPQKPRRRARERDEQAVHRGHAPDGPRVKKTPAVKRPALWSSTRAAC